MTLVDLLRQSPSRDRATALKSHLEAALEEFVTALNGIPVRQDAGSMSRPEAFWLWLMLRTLGPPLIIESGSATGWSAFVLASAAPEATILCLDPYRTPTALPAGASYLREDFSRATGRIDARRAVAIFDDHVNQRLRLVQARRAGLSSAFFHDVYPTLSHSTVSLWFGDLIGLASFLHTFDPLWEDGIIVRALGSEGGNYRWLTWVEIEDRPHGIIKRLRARRSRRNPYAPNSARRNWASR